MKHVAIVDYGMGNLDSVARAVEEVGGGARVTAEATEIRAASYVILPGVGAFRDGMRELCERRLDAILAEEVLAKQVPLLGICLGMQLLARQGTEGGEAPGLGWFDASVVRLQPDQPGTRVPHVGWNEVAHTRQSPLFESVPSGSDFYFVHSYHVVCGDPADVLGLTPYCGSFASAIGRDNLFGVQFHPEKSQRLGLQVLKNFLAY
jgi:glutamine amidotransferase